MQAIGICDQGKVRSKNQDTIFISEDKFGMLPNLFVISDGMGGHNAGEVASRLAVDSFCGYIEASQSLAEDVPDAAVNAIMHSNKTVFEEAAQASAEVGMGCTFLAATIADNKLYVFNIGDSRLYVAGGNNLKQITTDHTLVNEMLKSGNITADEAENHPQKNIITRALGTRETVQADVDIVELNEADTVLMCSDGLYNMVSDDEILEILKSAHDVSVKANKLLELANANGGTDNISIILIERRAV